MQGVGFRANAQAFANKCQLSGFVKNLPDGSVAIRAEGLEDNINKLIEWCYVGPRFASVEEVSANEVEVENYKTFELKR